MPKDKDLSKGEIALALRVFKKFLDDQQCIVVADEFYEWCEEQMKGEQDEM